MLIENREMFDKLISKVNRKGFDSLIKYLDVNGYYTAPASTNNHLATDGGLMQHSINVTTSMLDMAKALHANVSEESIIICGLFHDIGKADYYGKPNYRENILKSGLRSEPKPYEINKDLLGVPHEVVAIQELTRFIKLTEEEAHAIYFHNGLYTPSGYAIKGKETPLYLLLHSADMWASRVIEG